ncbi:hypothetical protein STENM223S_01798 [Streptomyces tendae]
MWDSSQAGPYFRVIRNGGRLRTSIPLICPAGDFIPLMNAFTECWYGIVPAVIGRAVRPAAAGRGRTRAGQGGPEPFSQKAPYSADAAATPQTTSADLAVRSRARPTAGGNSSGNAGSSSRGFDPK